MKCPTDNATLTMSERNGIEIDYRPECRGVWLDRGELDKIIERAGAEAQPQHAHEQPRYQQQQTHGQQPGYPQKRRKENWLSELFDQRGAPPPAVEQHETPTQRASRKVAHGGPPRRLRSDRYRARARTGLGRRCSAAPVPPARPTARSTPPSPR